MCTDFEKTEKIAEILLDFRAVSRYNNICC